MRFVNLLILCSLLVSCGGGGSSGSEGSGTSSSGNGNSNSNLQYSGSRNAGLVNEDTAFGIASTVLGSVSFIQTAQDAWIPISPPATRFQGKKRETISGTVGSAEAEFWFDGQDFIIETHYKNFGDENSTLNGKVKQREIADRETGVGRIYSPIQGSLTFDNLSITVAGESVQLNGKVVSSGLNSRILTANLLMTGNSSSESVLMENLSLDLNPIEESRFNIISFGGTIYETNYGKYSVQTLTPVKDFGFDNRSGHLVADGNGLLEIRGANTLRVQTISKQFLALLLDIDDDSSFERAQRVSWAAMYEDLPPIENSVNVHPPVANTGNRIESIPGYPTTLHGLFSHDEDNNFLTFSWQAVHTPLDSTLSRESHNTANFTFVPDEIGDYIFKLTVSDGEFSRNSYAKVSVEEFQPSVETSSKTELAALEVTPLETANEYLVSANSRMNHTDNTEESNVEWQVDDYFNVNSEAQFLSDYAGFSNVFVADETVPGYHILWFRTREVFANIIINTLSADFHILSEVPGEPIESVLSAKLNDDDIEDLILLGYDYDNNTQSNNIYIRYGEGNGNYSDEQVLSTPGFRPKTGDLDMDGDTDIATSDELGIYIYLQSESGFENSAITIPFSQLNCGGQTKSWIDIVDFDSDDEVEIVAIHPCDKNLQIWDYVSGSEFELTEIRVLPYLPTGPTIFEDINGDGLSDLAFGTYYGSASDYGSIVLINNGDDFDVALNVENQLSANSPDLNVVDLDDDNVNEVIVSEATSIKIFKLGENSEFTVTQSLSMNSSISQFDPAFISRDIDGDSDIDFVIGSLYDVFVFLNDNGVLRAVNLDSGDNANWPDDIAIMDYNNDGFMDILRPSNSLLINFGGMKPFSH